jgi:hypothetical protein
MHELKRDELPYPPLGNGTLDGKSPEILNRMIKKQHIREVDTDVQNQQQFHNWRQLIQHPSTMGHPAFRERHG